VARFSIRRTILAIVMVVVVASVTDGVAQAAGHVDMVQVLAGNTNTTFKSTGSQAAATLTGTVGPGFTIVLMKGSIKVTSLTTGTYTIVVNDMSSHHNFHLTGPGFNKATSVPNVGKTIWTVHLRVGTYTYVCDPHASFMRGSFIVQ
jgi:plastocyanin